MRPLRNSGAAEIIGTVFALLIVFTVVFAGILTSYQLQNNYTSAVLERRQMDLEQESELFQIYPALASPLVVTFLNTGPITITVADLFVRDLTLSTASVFNITEVLNSGASTSYETDVQFVKSHRYLFNAFTTRGSESTYLLDFKTEIRRANVTGLTGVVGPILLDFGTIRWSGTPPKDSPCSETGDFYIPYDMNNVIWSLNVTNLGEEAIELTGKTSFVAMAGAGGGNPAAKINQYYLSSPPPTLLDPGVPTTLYFAPGGALDSKDTTFVILVALVGSYAGPPQRPFSQTIPFQAIYVYNHPKNTCDPPI